MKIKKFAVKLRLKTPMLGTVPKDQEVYAAHIANRREQLEKNRGITLTLEEKEAKATEELANIDAVEEKGWTGFRKDETGIFLRDYMIRGFLKSAYETLFANGSIKKISAYKKWIDRMVFIEEEHIHILDDDGNPLVAPDGDLERPLRTMTPKGERTSVARSDYVNAGRELVFTFVLLENNKGMDEEVIMQMLEYGQFVGLGQWRGSGGYGKFQIVE